MPISINELLKEFDLQPIKTVRWGRKIHTEKEGVYFVSLSNNPDLNSGAISEIPICKVVLKKWIEKVGGFEIDKIRTFDVELIIKRLSEFWLPDENIVYIGKAPIRNNGKGIGIRINEFYNTDYGEKRPHAGGHWIKSFTTIRLNFRKGL
jgi:hypothetical protein